MDLFVWLVDWVNIFAIEDNRFDTILVNKNGTYHCYVCLHHLQFRNEKIVQLLKKLWRKKMYLKDDVLFSIFLLGIRSCDIHLMEIIHKHYHTQLILSTKNENAYIWDVLSFAADMQPCSAEYIMLCIIGEWLYRKGYINVQLIVSAKYLQLPYFSDSFTVSRYISTYTTTRINAVHTIYMKIFRHFVVDPSPFFRSTID